MRRLTQEQFLEKSKSVHGDKYDYSKSIYIKGTQKIQIICKVHGIFEQTPAQHISGNGCKKCGYLKNSKSSSKTYKDFKDIIEKVHGDEYDYVEKTFKNFSSKMTILCKKHGKFEQTPSAHASGQGCLKCGLEKTRKSHTLSKQEYVEKFKTVHGDKFDYSKMEYKNSKTKVIITCPNHGDFKQTPRAHLISKHGCPKCSGLLPISKKEFIERAVEKHGDRYDFSNLDYKGYNIRTEFVCREHGKFKTKPVIVVENIGCNKCSPTRKRTTKEIIKEFEDVHGDFYDYSKVNYIDNLTKVDIICPHHGEFKQRPKQHKRGEGCYFCGVEKSASNNINNRGFYSAKRARRYKEEWKKIKANLYYIKITTKNESFYKIGITTWSIEDRFKYVDGRLDIIYSLESNLYDACIKENIILKEYNYLQYIPVIKMNHGNTECFEKHLPNVENFIFD